MGVWPEAGRLGIPEVIHLVEVGSTMDAAHARAEAGAAAGTIVLADRQLHGRGRSGRVWSSEAGAGVWFTMIERDVDVEALGVLSLRLGLAVAVALEPWCDAPVRVKWPNDVFAGTGKVAGILVEARWRDGQPEWVAIGVGINRRRPPDQPDAAAVRAGVSVADVLTAVVPPMRAAARAVGPLTPDEQRLWAARDFVAGRIIDEPVAGTVLGIAADGALRVRPSGAPSDEVRVHAGSIRFPATTVVASPS